MNTSSNQLAADGGMDNSNIVPFRDKPIKWKIEIGNRTRVFKNAIDADNSDIEEKEIENNIILYEDKEYTREQFFIAMYEDYKKHKYKVKFNTDNVFYLGGSQRAKLQYHILAVKYGLVQVDKQDTEDLTALCGLNDSSTSRDMLYRLSWFNDSGLEYMVSFGAALDVRGSNKGVYCYTANITDSKAEYKGVKMEWEKWLKPIIRALDDGRKNMKNAKNANERFKEYNNAYDIARMNLYYQNKTHLTITKEIQKAIHNWFRSYLLSGKDELKYSGLMPNSDIAFTIDFDKDIEIVKQHDNTTHNQEIARNKVLQTFSGLKGNAWTTAELKAQGFNRGNIERFASDTYRLIKRVKHGHYIRLYE